MKPEHGVKEKNAVRMDKMWISVEWYEEGMESLCNGTLQLPTLMLIVFSWKTICLIGSLSSLSSVFNFVQIMPCSPVTLVVLLTQYPRCRRKCSSS